MTKDQILIPIQKEELPGIVFSKTDVLIEDSDRKKRKHDLYEAMLLGNRYKRKVKIHFDTYNHRHLEIETTVWQATDQNVVFKGGVTIPIHSIKEVLFHN